MDDRALLKQAFLEAHSTEREPSEQDLESFEVSEKTDRKIHRIIYRKSRRKRMLHTVSVAARSTIAILLAVGMFFFPRIETDADFKAANTFFITDHTSFFMLHIDGNPLPFDAVQTYDFTIDVPSGFALNSESDSGGRNVLWYRPEAGDSTVSKHSLIYFEYSLYGETTLTFDLRTCVERGWRRIGGRDVYWVKHPDAQECAWIENVDGKDYIIELDYYNEDGVTEEAFEKLVMSVTAFRKGA